VNAELLVPYHLFPSCIAWFNELVWLVYATHFGIVLQYAVGVVQCLNRSATNFFFSYATNWNRCTSCTVNGTQHVHIFLISEFYCKHLFASHRWRLSKRLLFLYELFWLAFSVWPTESYHVWRQQHPKYTDDAGCSNVVAGKCELPPGIFNKLFFVPDHISSVLAAFYLIRFAAIHELFWIAFSVWPNRTTSRCFIHRNCSSSLITSALSWLHSI